MPYSQDRKYDHWLKVSPKNIAETKAKDMGGMQGKEPPVDWDKLVKENANDEKNFKKPWEAEGDGTFGTQYDGRKPSYGKAGDTARPTEESVKHERTESRSKERRERERGES